MTTTTTPGAVASMTAREWRVLLAGAPKGSIKPILAELHVGADGTVSATDLAVTVQRRGDDGRERADVDPMLVPRRVLEALCKGRGVRSVVQLAETGGTGLDASVDGRAVGSRERGSDPAEWPTLEVVETGDDVFRVPCVKTWAARLEAAAVHAARERTRFAFNGVHLQLGPAIRGGSALLMVATDGKRLSVEAVPVVAERWGVDAVGEPTSGWIVDLGWVKTVGRVARLLGGVEGIIKADRKRTTLEAGSWTVTGRNLEGRFPQWSSVMPQAPTELATFRAVELLEALSVCETSCAPESKSVRFGFHAADGIVLTSRAVDVGESRVEVAGGSTGLEGCASFNPEYVRDAVAFLEAGADDVVQVRAAAKGLASELERGFADPTTWTVPARPERLVLVMPVTLRTGRTGGAS